MYESKLECCTALSFWIIGLIEVCTELEDIFKISREVFPDNLLLHLLTTNYHESTSSIEHITQSFISLRSLMFCKMLLHNERDVMNIQPDNWLIYVVWKSNCGSFSGAYSVLFPRNLYKNFRHWIPISFVCCYKLMLVRSSYRRTSSYYETLSWNGNIFTSNVRGKLLTQFCKVHAHTERSRRGTGWCRQWRHW
jgi:hypothetical protein